MSRSQKPVTELYRRDEVIGRGNFGTVYKGVDRATKQLVAIKVLDLDTIEDDLIDIQQEISTLSQLSQSEAANIVKYFGSFLHRTKLWIIMDLCAGGSVRTLLKAGKLEERHIAVVLREVCVALAYIHKEGIIHRDIKAANILITNSGLVRLCDFGVAAKVTANKVKRSTIVGTPYWMAPEVITEGALYNTKADIWSLGVTVYEIATGNPPYSDQEALRAIMLIPRQKPARLEGSQYSPALKEFVAQCLDEHPDERLSAEDLLKVKFIKTSRSYPTSILKEVVQRYMTWRERNNVRDSIALIKGIKEGDDYSDEGEEVTSDNESVWDFDTSDTTTFDYGQMSPIRKDTQTSPPSSAIQSAIQSGQNTTKGLSGLGFQYPSGFASSESTMRAPAPPALDPAAPKSLLSLFEDDHTPAGGSVSVPLASPSSDLHPAAPPGSNPAALSAAATQPSTPTIEIEIPNFDSMESEANATAKPPPPPQQLPPPQMPMGPPPQIPPQIPPQSAQRSRSNTLSNTITPQSLHQHSLPPVPSIPAIQSEPQSQQQQQSQQPQQSQSQPQSGTSSPTQMLPPQMPHNTMRRAPSPKRMTAKTPSSSAGSSPPKQTSSMKPIVRSKLSSSETSTDMPPPPPTSQAPLRRKQPRMHIAMPPPPSLSLASQSQPTAQDDTLIFPPVPRLDTSILLDSTQKQDVVNHLDQLLDGFSVGLASLEEGLYNLVT